MTAKNRNTKEYLVIMILYVWLLILLPLCQGCGSNRDELSFKSDVQLAWPAPPEKPRIIYLGMISTEADLKAKTSWTQGLGELLFGKSKIGVLVAPSDVAIDRNDRLFVTDSAGAAVHLFDLNKRTYKQFAETAGKEKLLKPVGLTIVDNRIYVVDSILCKVCVFDTKGKYIFSFGGERFIRPSGIAYSQEDEIVYVADTAGHKIEVFTRDGKYIEQIGSRGMWAGQFNFPTHLWVDKSGRLYVSDTLNYRIQVFSRQRRFLQTFGQQGDRPGNFAHPCGIATDAFDNIYVTDRQFENVQVFDRQGQILLAFGQEGTQAGQFWLPAGLFIDHRNRIYVADSFNKRIQVFQLME
ncbi:MAG: 6-bladed beta-propeller [Planctomycetota bacterium]|jgi:DNA-binding beta-propeller fold protein YncE